MKQIAAAQVGDDDSGDNSDDDSDGDSEDDSDNDGDDDSDDDSEDGAVAEPVTKKQRTGASGGGSHKWIPDDPSAWTWKSKKGKGRCACGCVVDKPWHTFNRKTKGG